MRVIHSRRCRPSGNVDRTSCSHPTTPASASAALANRCTADTTIVKVAVRRHVAAGLFGSVSAASDSMMNPSCVGGPIVWSTVPPARTNRA